MKASVPANEIARLRALRQLRILDTPADAEFDELSRLAAMACGTSKAFVTFIESDRQWLKAAYGADRGETPRSEAFCAHTILQPDGVLVIPDARLDARFANNPRVVEDGVRFYAGVPLTLPSGETLGALCVVDDQPRQLNEHQLDMLIGLGNLANSNLAKRQRRTTAAGYSQEILPITEAEHLSLISRFTSNGVLLTDTKSTILWMNDGSARLTGYQPEEVIGQTPRLFHSPNTDPTTLKYIRSQLSGRLPVSCEILNRSKAGLEYWVYLEIQPIFDDHGDLSGYIGFQTDITERKRQEDSLRASEMRFRSLFELAPVGMALNRYVDGKFLDGNPALFAMLGYTEEEFRGLSNWDVTPIEYEPQEVVHDEALFLHGQYGPYEKEYVHKDGYRIPVLLNGVLFEDENGEGVVFSIIQNISERRRNERLKSEFLATVSHELRTPLTAIHGALRLLASGALGTLNDSSSEMLHLAEQNSQRLIELINDLLDMEKLTAGGMSFHIKAHALTPLIRSVMEQLKPFTDKHQVELLFDAPSSGLSAMLDPDRFTQILTNLLSNAAKFSPPECTVVISVEPLEDVVRIAVEDNGPGIPDDFLPRLFERFAQADGSSRRAQGGTGLGLAISKALAEQMNGQLGYKPAAEKGSIFYVDLPASKT
ncbi:PAS domain S-box protein [Salinispirillum sp. LH 10-3-1]|uniref:histidine kinase n=1 Tax=Salinispirillum sp. LH 10-3-1 TaxID=2952525 RepID=A0AB38YFE0_9GAMM